MVLSVDNVRGRISGRAPILLPTTGPYAAVAAVLRYTGDEPDVLLIKRSELPHDPWSGHMAFPGGRQQAGDADLVATAVRETLEEVGVNLAVHADLLGRLDDVQAIARAEITDLVIVPHVFVLTHEVMLTPAPGEVDVALWAPLGPMLRAETLTGRPYERNGVVIELPGFQVGSYIVWGLTYRMLDLLFDVLRA